MVESFPMKLEMSVWWLMLGILCSAMLQATWPKGEEDGQKQLELDAWYILIFFFVGFEQSRHILEEKQYAVNSRNYCTAHSLLPSANTGGVRQYNGVHDLLFTDVWGQSLKESWKDAQQSCDSGLHETRFQSVLAISLSKIQNVRQNSHWKWPWGKKSA